jgi:hypothetical protein
MPKKLQSRRRESNPRPADYKSAALPTELLRLLILKSYLKRATNLQKLAENTQIKTPIIDLSKELLSRQKPCLYFRDGKGKGKLEIPKF